MPKEKGIHGKDKEDAAGAVLRDRFRGALIGTLVGDALGMPVEGYPGSMIKKITGEVRDMLPGRFKAGCYTDDTQMMVALAEALLKTPGQLNPGILAQKFVLNFEEHRGYGGNVWHILKTVKNGASWKSALDSFRLPGGSYANGAAMRVAPVPLACYPDEEKTVLFAIGQADVTGHTHSIARFGAHLQAVSILRLIKKGAKGEPIHEKEFVAEIKDKGPAEFERTLSWIGENPSAEPEEAAYIIGTSGIASESVPAALWSFLSAWEDPEAAVIRAVNLGGDTDTIGALTGSLAGAYHGVKAFPVRWMGALENTAKGRDYILSLADRLWEITVCGVRGVRGIEK
jgi:poly(ADP-ribose) glycohydrolase ARH3